MKETGEIINATKNKTGVAPWVKPLFEAIRASGYVVTMDIVNRHSAVPRDYMDRLRRWNDDCRRTLVDHFLNSREEE